MSSDISPLQARTLLRRYELKPRKTLGQNFLVNAGARESIIEIAGLNPGEVVLEIGPGLGALTERLVEEAGRVVAVELDEALFQILKTTLGDIHNLELVLGDILEFAPADLGLDRGYVVVANIPYNITSAVIRHLMESKIPAARVVLTVQKEVAERIVAGPGDMSLLALSVQVFGAASIRAQISRGSFYPTPTVDSSVVHIKMHSSNYLNPADLGTFFKLARAGFGQKRKQLRNALSGGMPIDKPAAEQLLQSCGIEPSSRAQRLSVEDWMRLSKAYQSYRGS
ncbi:MAG: 16S rRNA (adenine(1518)-N(6)/adenine(1519)-N(6))-dimethyltransferase RsmA [Anaerolineales bacterium]|jgi:16S rRNA (adenine1518-N6/adenine1519-N6)-dimethyltransferase